MSSEQTGESSQLSQSQSPITTDTSPGSQYRNPSTSGKAGQESQTYTTAETGGDDSNLESDLDKKPAAAANPDQPSDITSPSTPDDPRIRPRQVIAVSASKGPAAFFNLARKFLVTDEMCDLSALEGAIVSAADAAHLLERSKLATIVRYVSFIPGFGQSLVVDSCLTFHVFLGIEYKRLMSLSNPKEKGRFHLLRQAKRRRKFHHRQQVRQSIPVGLRLPGQQLAVSCVAHGS